MKSTLPTTWTNQKMVSLFLLTWISANRVKAGKGFSNCLINNNDNTSYNLLLNYQLSNDKTINSDQKLRLCCDGSTSSCLSNYNVNCDPVFSCSKVSQMIVCEGNKCGGVVGDTKINNNATLSDCAPSIANPSNTARLNLTNIANYLTDTSYISVGDEYATWNCPNYTSSCSNFKCYWDSGGWTCYSLVYAAYGNCLWQLPSSFPTSASSTILPLTSFSDSTTFINSISSLSNFPTSHPTYEPTPNSSNNLNLTKILIPVGTIIGVIYSGGVIHYIWKRRKKSQNQNQEIKINLAGKITELEQQIRLLRSENNEFQAQKLETDQLELATVLSDYENYGNISEERVPIIKKYFNIQNVSQVIIDSTFGDNPNFSHNTIINQTQEESYEMESRHSYQEVSPSVIN